MTKPMIAHLQKVHSRDQNDAIMRLYERVNQLLSGGRMRKMKLI